jgi:transaldolase
MYVEQLVTRGVVNTMPRATIDAVAEEAEITGDTVRGNYAADREVIGALEKLGISYDEVVQVLEDEGVSKFAVSWSDLQEATATAMGALGSVERHKAHQ